MPTNVTVEYANAELEYQKASRTEEKIAALEKMLSTCPTHKGCEKLRQDIKTKLAKFKALLKKEAERKSKGFSIAIKKEGAAQIVLVGPPNSGKSLLLNKLTNKKVAIGNYSFTTKMPNVGIMKYKGLKIQVVDMPPIVKDSAYKGKGPQFFSIIRNADLVIIVTDKGDLDRLFKEFEKSKIRLNEEIKEREWENLQAFILLNKNDLDGADKVYESLCKYYNFDIVRVSALKDKDIERLKDEVWKHLGLIKVYTKEPGKKVKKDEPLCLDKGATIKDMASHIHKDFIRKFRFARVWGKSAKFDEQKVGLKHKLEDDDIVEVHLR